MFRNFLSGEILTSPPENLSTRRIKYTRHIDVSESVNIHDSNFIDINYHGYGGAIYHNHDSNLYVNHCMFQNCHSSVEGGAIFKANGNFYSSFICYYMCYVSDEYNYAVGNCIYSNSKIIILNSTISFNCTSGPYFEQTNFKILNSTVLFSINNNTNSIGLKSACFAFVSDCNTSMRFVDVNHGSNQYCVKSIGEFSKLVVKDSNFIFNDVKYMLGDVHVTCNMCYFFRNNIHHPDRFLGTTFQFSISDFKMQGIQLFYENIFTQELRSHLPTFCSGGEYPINESRGHIAYVMVPQDMKIKRL